MIINYIYNLILTSVLDKFEIKKIEEDELKSEISLYTQFNFIK